MRSAAPVIVLAAAALGACARAPQPDAYGNMEATEVVVGAQASGPLTRFVPAEGDRLAAGAVVAVVDTTPLALQLAQIDAQRAASASRTTETVRQTGVLEVQRAIALRAYERTRRLFDLQAATAQQLDQAERDYRTLDQQIRAAQAQQQSATHDVASTDARAAQIHDQIRRALVTNPIAGTVLATYVKAGEVVQTGQPLYRVADLDTLELRAYVTEPQLAQLRLGQPARVTVDTTAGGRRTVTGVVSWIASEAEFTPTPIQTRDERANLVYAVKIRVPNVNGALKIGMPADVRFGTMVASAAR